MIAFFIYSSALQTVLLIAAYFGEQEINWPQDEKTIGLIVSILLIQLIAMFGAILTSKLSEKFGNIFTLIILNIFWAFLCIGAYFITEPNEFWKVVPKEEVPRNTKGNAQAAITINNLGPVKKFLSDSIIAI